MDPETQRRIAALLMEEASRLRTEAEQEGVHVYLSQPKQRGRPNPRFLKATVRGVQLENRIAEENDMWRRRALELENEHETERYKHRHRDAPFDRAHSDKREAKASRENPSSTHHHENYVRQACSASNSSGDDSPLSNGDLDHWEGSVEDDGLKDNEVEEFLKSRVKRGRGGIGPRMDDTGPYPLPYSAKGIASDLRMKEDWEERIMGDPLQSPSLVEASDPFRLGMKQKQLNVEHSEAATKEISRKSKDRKRRHKEKEEERRKKRKKRHRSLEKEERRRKKKR